jgi:hypothetical protein
MIEDSSGIEPFERAALHTVQRWMYEPATLNGTPVERSMAHAMLTFRIDASQTGATRAFVRKYHEISKHLKAGELQEADKLITDLEFGGRHNLYEDAWFWWAKFQYLAARGQAESWELQQALQRAIGYEDDYLPPDAFVAAAQQLFVHRARSHDYGGAIQIFERLQRSWVAKRAPSYEQVVTTLTPIYSQIKGQVTGDAILLSKGRIGEHGYWVHDLLRRAFSIANVQGSLEFLQVRCKQANSRFDTIPEENTFTVPASWDECGVYVKGAEATTFDFLEAPVEGAEIGDAAPSKPGGKRR